MSSSDRGLDLARPSGGGMSRLVRGGLVALALGVLAAGCTVQPIYMTIANGPNVAADLSAISVEDVSDRVGQEVRNNLIFGFTGGGASAPPRYELTMRVTSADARLGFERDETAPAYSVTVTVAYQLKEIATGKVILRSINRGVASYDRSNQAFANQRAQIDAQNRAAQSVADDIQLRLAAALASGRSS
ncbi:MAG: LPS assembly lipoprotein LptE [Candidatus Kaistia colombiensis]|nr:MAG: LPS assembly lipoprotein LptE [Kaistia sp.]